MQGQADAPVRVTNHAVRRFAERADGIAIPRAARITDAQALEHLSSTGYPVEDVRRMIAVHAEIPARSGATGVPFDRVMVRIVGNAVVTCLPRRSSPRRSAEPAELPDPPTGEREGAARRRTRQGRNS